MDTDNVLALIADACHQYLVLYDQGLEPAPAINQLREAINQLPHYVLDVHSMTQESKSEMING